MPYTKSMVEMFSQKRLDKYSSFDAYIANIKTSQLYYPKLHLIEICLRNKINNLLLKHLGTNWIFSNTHLIPNDQLAKVSTQKDHDDNIANLTFGVWINILDKHYNLFTDADLTYLFNLSKKQVNHQYSRLCEELRMIKNFRNRVFHYERIDKHHRYKHMDTLTDKFIKLLDIDSVLYNAIKQLSLNS